MVKNMLYQSGMAINTRIGQSYIWNMQHRNGNPNKSQWIINHNQEIHVFEYSYGANWISRKQNKKFSWGLNLINEVPSVLGETAKNCELPLQFVRIAKFVEGTQTWHGYPANYRCNSQDRPDPKILENWYTRGYIRKDEIKKVRNMKPCSLSS